MNKLFRVLLIIYLVTSPVLILFLVYKAVFLTNKIYELQNDFLSRNAVETYPVEALDTEFTPYIGSPNARIKVFWYTDVDCYACRGSFENIMEISNAYSQDVVVFFKLLPSGNEADLLTHQLLLHAWNEGQFLDLATILFSDSASRKPSSLESLRDEFSFPRNESKALEAYNMALAQNLSEFQALGTYSTPTFVVNGRVWSGSDKVRLLSEIQAVLASP